MSDIKYEKLKRNDIVHYVRVMKNLGLYEVLELKIGNVNEKYCTAIDNNTKQTFLINKDNAEELLFFDRKKAVQMSREIEKMNKKEKHAENS